MEEIRELAE